MSKIDWEEIPVAATKTVFPEQLIKQLAEADDKIIHLEARLSEAVKVLEGLGAAIEAERIAWSSTEYSGGFNDGCNTAIRIVGSQARNFLTSLGKEDKQ